MSKEFFMNIWDKVFCDSGERWCNVWSNLISSCSSDHWRLLYWLIITLLVILVYFLFNKSRISKYVSKHLLQFSAIVWFVGFLIYIIGYYKESLSGWSVVPRAFLSSFKMFAMSYDITHVDPKLQDDAIYAAAFMLTHCAAIYITFVFVFKMIGYKGKSALRIIRYNLGSRFKTKVVHMFWGVNEASLSLAESISASRSNKTDQIIFVDIDEEECKDCSNKKVTLNRITNIITISEDDIERLDKINALVAHCYNGPARLSEIGDNDIFKSLNLNRVGKSAKRSRELHCYFLSDDETNNILGALNLQRDWRIQEKLAKQSNVNPKDNKVFAYVHARKDSNNEIFDHYSQYDANTKRMKFKLVDSACLAIEQLKMNDNTLPVNCVDVEPHTGCVNSPFNAMVIGFGGTGQEAFKFLYEFSAFIDKNKNKTPFKCYAIDENMDRIAGYITAKMPAIREDELELIKTKVDSELFWEKISDLIDSLNYVVISLNDDMLGLSIAVNLFKYALQHRTEEARVLKIVIRCYDRSNEIRMREVINNLNNSIKGSKVELVLFGSEQTIYTYDLIVSDKILNEAKEFNRVYENSKFTADEQWEKNFGKKWIDGKIKANVSRYHAIYEANSKIAQNYSNALHCRTKIRLMELAEHDFLLQLKQFDAYVRGRKPYTIKYPCSPEIEQLFLNMAMVEHERWIAAHKLMGFVYGKEKDKDKNMVKKTHACIIPFDKLEKEETKSYDCNVIDTTIKLEYQKKIMQMISNILTLDCKENWLKTLKSDILAEINNVAQFLNSKEYLNHLTKNK